MANSFTDASVILLDTHGIGGVVTGVGGGPPNGMPAVCWTNGDGGSLGIENARQRAYDVGLAQSGELTQIGYSHHGSFGYGFYFTFTSHSALTNILGNKPHPGGLFIGSFCYSANVAPDFNCLATGYATEALVTRVCADNNELLSRIFGARPYVKPTYRTAVCGPTWTDNPCLPCHLNAGGISTELDLYNIPTCTPTDGALCGVVSRWGVAATFADHGFLQDTVYCRTLDEKRSESIMLRAYSTQAAWPTAPETLGVFSARGGPGLTTDYFVTDVPQRWRYEWVEVDSGGGITASGLFGHGDLLGSPTPQLNDGQARGYAGIGGMGADVAVAEYVPGDPSVLAPPHNQNCADVVIYARTAEMGASVFSNLADDVNPRGLKVRVVLGGSSTVQSFRNAMQGVVNENVAYNAWCEMNEELCTGHIYPTRPEVYLVGDVKGADTLITIGTFKYYLPSEPDFPASQVMISDALMYDLDNNGVPDGPIARIPVDNATEAGRAALFARQWNRQQYVDGPRRSMALVGDMYNNTTAYTYSRGAVDSFLTALAGVGVARGSLLRASDLVTKTYNEKFELIDAALAAGAAEVVGYGGYTLPGLLPANMWPCNVVPREWDHDARFIAWMPGCYTHDSYRINPFNDPANGGEWCQFHPILKEWGSSLVRGMGCAGSVGTQNNDFQDRHQNVLRLLREARAAAGQSGTRPSLARLVFDVISQNMQAFPDHKRSLLGLSAWGSYVEIPPTVLASARMTAATPLCLNESGQHTVVIANMTAPVTYLWQTSPLCGSPAACANRVWTTVGTSSAVSLSRTASYSIRVTVADAAGRILQDDADVEVRECSDPGGGCPVVDALSGEGWREENTILGRSSTGEVGLDSYRLSGLMNLDGALRLRIREAEEEITSLDQVRLIAIDHRAELRAFSCGERVILGNRVPARRVTTRDGVEITESVRGDGPGYFAAEGETLLVELQSTLPPGATHANPSGDGPPIIDDGGGKGGGVPQAAASPVSSGSADAQILATTGILLQVAASGGGWESVAHYYPREHPSEAVFDSVRASVFRMVFLHGHRVAFLGSVAEAPDSLEAMKLSPVSARHSRLGDVLTEVVQAGNVTTTLMRGDTLELEFHEYAPAPDKVREYFLLSRGVYTSNLPASQRPAGVPLQFALVQNRPNPFSGRTTIHYDVPRATRVRLEVFDLQGRRVKTLVDREVAPGSYAVEWDQSRDDGSLVRAGVYLYRMVAPEYRTQRKMVVIR